MLRRTIFVLVSLLVLSMLLQVIPISAACTTTSPCTDQRFLDFWEDNGALPVFGYAITAADNELNRDLNKTFLTQWFERNRFELHPENTAPYTILLGRLGDDRLRQLGRDWRTFPKARPGVAHYFPETGHAIAPEFWNYWRRYGLDLGDPGISTRENLALFGYPLSEPSMETNSSGDTVLTQWFERARFEWHPKNVEPYKVLLGRLGSEVRGQGTMPPPTRVTLVPTPTTQSAATPTERGNPTNPTARPTSSPTTSTAIPPTATPQRSTTAVPPTATPQRSATAVPPTAVPPTATPQRSATAVPPTAVPPTNTALIPTEFPTVNPTNTALPPPGSS